MIGTLIGLGLGIRQERHRSGYLSGHLDWSPDPPQPDPPWPTFVIAVHSGLCGHKTGD